MIHGGGFMTLSRKAVRPAQAKYLLAKGLLPISIDYRLCPEVNLVDGPITDVRDAYAWARREMPSLIAQYGILVDSSRAVTIGWSTGGHLAMSLGWTAEQVGLSPPLAVLSFYAPVDFESGGTSLPSHTLNASNQTLELDNQKNHTLPKPRLSLSQIAAALPKTPITHYGASVTDETNLGWLRPGDPRSELLLTVFHSDIGLPLMLCGLPSTSTSSLSSLPRPSHDLVASISPLARVRSGAYTVPTFIIHGTKDVIAPFPAAERFVSALADCGVEVGFLGLQGKPHVFDVGVRPGVRGWEEWVEPGLEFLVRRVRV